MQVLGIVGAVLIVAGIVAFVYGFLMRARVGRVSDAPFVKTGEAAQKGTAVANARGAISAEGNVSCPQPLVSPVSGTTCIYYEIKVTAEWKDGQHLKTKEMGHEKRAAQFSIDDGSGPVWVDAREGGDFEPEQVKSETKGHGLLGGIAGGDLVFGNYRVSTGILSAGTKYTVKETVVPAVPKLYVCGKVGSSNEITKPSWRSLLITHKSREDFLGHAMATAKYCFIGGGAGLGLGAILGVVAALVGGGHSAKAAPTPADTTVATATAAPADTSTAAPPAAKPAAAPPAATPAPAKPAAKKKK
jgi:E3 Ubiquitin ligase